MTSVYKCRIDGATATTPTYDCNNRKNCITLSGLFYCQVGYHLTKNIHRNSAKTFRKEFVLKYLSLMTVGECVMVLRSEGEQEVREGRERWSPGTWS